MLADHTPRRDSRGAWMTILIIGLALIIAFLLFWQVSAQRHLPPTPATSMSAQGRLLELQYAAKAFAPPHLRRFLTSSAPQAALSEPWDQAVLAILSAEDGQLEKARDIAKGSGVPSTFQRIFDAAYLAQDLTSEVSPTDRTAVRAALRDGYASRLLESRLETPETAERLRQSARAWSLPKLAGLSAAGLVFLLLLPSGIAVGIVLLASPSVPRMPSPLRLSGTALTMVFLCWFLAFLLSGHVTAIAIERVPSLRPLALPLTYGLHASLGLALVCAAEGASLKELLHRLMPGNHGKSVAWSFAFLALAVLLVVIVSLLVSRYVQAAEPPQRELMELVGAMRGPLPFALLFLTIACAAPLFEEFLFRGILLPWLGQHLEPRLGARAGWTCAVLLTGLGFGLIHLHPIALPVLSTLGAVLGMAFLRTGNLLTAIFMHSLWNGGVFLFYRVVLG